MQGIPKECDQEKLLNTFKKNYSCDGALVEDEEMGGVIQLHGDQRARFSLFLTNQKVVNNDRIKTDGLY